MKSPKKSPQYKPIKNPRDSLNSTPTISHHKQKVNTAHAFSRTNLIKDILRNAKAAGIPVGSAEVFAEKTADHVEAWIKHRATVTESDLRRVIAQKLSTFSSDLAFFYKNNGKII